MARDFSYRPNRGSFDDEKTGEIRSPAADSARYSAGGAGADFTAVSTDVSAGVSAAGFGSFRAQQSATPRVESPPKKPEEAENPDSCCAAGNRGTFSTSFAGFQRTCAPCGTGLYSRSGASGSCCFIFPVFGFMLAGVDSFFAVY